MITIIDGPDGAGKTTLAKKLAARSDARITHHGTYQDYKPEQLALRYLASMRPSQLRSEHKENRVLDRSWYSEPIYGAVMRRGANRIGIRRRILERVALALEGVLVYCRAPYSTCRFNWAERKGAEYVQETDKFQRVYQGYDDMMRPSQVGLPMMLYDYVTNEPINITESIIARTRARPNRGPGIGNWKPDEVVLMVGEQAGPTATGSWAQLPFCSFLETGCSLWLAQQLESYGVPESRLYWVNAIQPDGTKTDPAFIEELRPLRVVALGAVAAGWCQQAGLRFFENVAHPQYWKRFRHGQTYPLAEVFYDIYSV